MSVYPADITITSTHSQYSRFVVIKRNNLFDRLEEDWKVMLKDMSDKTAADRNKVIIPVLEEQGVSYNRVT